MDPAREARPDRPRADARRERLAGAGAAVVLGSFVAANVVLLTAPPAPPRVTLPAQAAAVASVLADDVTAALGLLGPVRGRLVAAEAPDWKAFDDLVAGSPLRRPTQELVAWLPRISAATRERFEAESGRDAFRSLRIVEPGRDGANLIPAAPRAHHHPIALAAPREAGADLLGLDLQAVPELEAALSRARRDGEPRIVGPLTLLPAGACAATKASARPGCTPLVLVVVPVARKGGDSGFLVAGLSWSAIASGAATRVAAQPPATPLRLLEPRAASASFEVQGVPFTVELRAEPGQPLTARLGHGPTRPRAH